MAFELSDSLRWLRRCRITMRVTTQANIPILCGSCALLEAVLLRCAYEVLRVRQQRGGDTRTIRGKIERSEYYGQAVINLARELFPTSTHPRCGRFVKHASDGRLKLLFRVRNIGAHGGSVWTQMELPKTLTKPVKHGEFLAHKYDDIFSDLESLGYDFKSADGVYGLRDLFKRNDVVDPITAIAFDFLQGLLAALREDGPEEAEAFHNCGINWLNIAEALTGHKRPM